MKNLTKTLIFEKFKALGILVPIFFGNSSLDVPIKKVKKKNKVYCDQKRSVP